MVNKIEKQKQLNLNRYIILQKGTVNIKDIERFQGCGYKTAKYVYDEIKEQVESEGKKVSIFGLEVSRLLDYLGIDKKDIIRNYNSL